MGAEEGLAFVILGLLVLIGISSRVGGKEAKEKRHNQPLRW
jgi:hypothetical protein